MQKGEAEGDDLAAGSAHARPSWSPQLPQNSAPGRFSKLQDAQSAMTRTSVGRLQAETAPRPGLLEVIAVWTGLGLVALAILVTYARLPLEELYNVSCGGLEGGARARGRLRRLSHVARGHRDPRRRRRPAADTWVSVVAVVAAILCATVAWPGVVEQDDLDVKPANALAAAGTLIALGLTILALRRGGVGYRASVRGRLGRRSPRRGGDRGLLRPPVVRRSDWLPSRRRPGPGLDLPDGRPAAGARPPDADRRPSGAPPRLRRHAARARRARALADGLHAAFRDPAHRVSLLRVADARLRPRERPAGLLARAAREARERPRSRSRRSRSPRRPRPGRRSLRRLSSSISQPGA